MSDRQKFSDRAIGVALGFVIILIMAMVVGVPLDELAIWAVVFTAVGAVYLTFLRRRMQK